MTGKRPVLTAFGTDRKHQTTDRLVSEDELEALLAWWRTTAKDCHGDALFCRHFEHVGRCDQCPAALGHPNRCRRGVKP